MLTAVVAQSEDEFTVGSNVATVTVGNVPWGSVYDPGNGETYISNDMSGTVSVLNASVTGDILDVVATITVGTNPRTPIYDPQNGNIYVPDWGSSSVSVISDATNTVIATVPVGLHPGTPAYDSVNGDIYVPCGCQYGSENTTVISGATNSVVASLGLSTTLTPTIDTANDYVFVSTGSYVWIIDGSTNKLMMSHGGPTELNFSSDPGYQWAPGPPLYNPDNGNVYVPNSGGDQVDAFSGNSNQLVATYTVGFGPGHPVFDPTDDSVWVSSTGCPSDFVPAGQGCIAVIDENFTGDSPFSEATVRDPLNPVFDCNNGWVVSGSTSAFDVWTTSRLGDAYSGLSGNLSQPVGAVASYDSRVGVVLIPSQGGYPGKVAAYITDSIGTGPDCQTVDLEGEISETESTSSGTSSITTSAMFTTNELTEIGGSSSSTASSSVVTSSFTSSASASESSSFSSTTAVTTTSSSLSSAVSYSCSSTSEVINGQTVTVTCSNTMSQSSTTFSQTAMVTTGFNPDGSPQTYSTQLAISGNISASQVTGLSVTATGGGQNKSGSFIVSFAISGQSGTSGTVTVKIPKSMIPNGLTPLVYIDGSPATDQSYTQDSNYYYVTLSTHFSTHEVQIEFTATTSTPASTFSPTATIIAAAAVGATLLGLGAVYFLKRANRNPRDSPAKQR